MLVNHVNEEVGKGVGKWKKWKVENGGGGKRKGKTWRAKVDMLAKLWGWECGGLLKANERLHSSDHVEVVHQSSV